MKRKLYSILVPRSVKDKLYEMHVGQYLQEELKRRSEYKKQLSYANLSSVYIENLKVIANKNDLLGKLPIKGIGMVVGDASWDFINQLLIIIQPQKLYTIHTNQDVNNVELLNYQFRTEIQSKRVEFIIGECDVEIEKLPDESVDWVYIDINNLCLNISALLELSRRKIKSSGLIAGNNYAVGDWVTLQTFGVIEAVNSFCKKNGWELTYLTNESDRNLNYALRKINDY